MMVMNELDKTMYFGAKPDILEKAKALRKSMTDAEKILWERLKNKQILNLRFRRQHPIDIFISDFYCHTVRLVIELDGKIHKAQKEYDEGRTAEMERFDIQVIRFRNEEIENDIENVINKIGSIIRQRLKSPPWGI
ncbi:endonuclease domain-containing protein [Maribellus sp. CM-23]|nr:endonuclease domain-containing protein [Maribellus sp. CM-23]